MSKAYIISPETVERIRHLYWDCNYNSRQIASIIGTSKTTVLFHLKKKEFGVRTTSESQIGNKRRWKGENAGYVAKHMWIAKFHGKASICELNPEHKAKRFEWANISGLYKRERNDYIQLCPSCHRKFDLRKSKYCRHGHLFTDENTYIDPRGFRQCKICRKEAQKRWKNATNY